MATVATPFTYSGFQGADLRLSFMIEAEIRKQLADMGSIRSVIGFAGDLSGTGSDTLKMRLTNAGAKTPFASAVDGADVAASTLDATTASISLGRSALRYDISDLAVMTGIGADIDPFSLGAAMAESAEARIMEVICATFPNATTSSGSTGVDMDVDDFLNAIYSLELADNNGPFNACLHPRQLADLQAALRTENNNFLAFMAATADISAAKGQGYAGDLLGVSIYKSSHVPLVNASADRCGLMWGSGGLAYAVGTPRAMVSGTELRPAGTPVVISFQRDESKGLTEIVGHLYCGASIVESSRVVKIVTDA